VTNERSDTDSNVLDSLPSFDRVDGVVYLVPSSDDWSPPYAIYHFTDVSKWVCTCMSYRYRDGEDCKHITRVKAAVDV
jgi:hypothetical protein